jgi:hypothetical protein
MNYGKKALMIPLVLIALSISYSYVYAQNHEEHQHEGHLMKTVEGGQAPEFVAMPGPGKKVQIGNGGYLIFGFDKKPQMGTVIMKVEVYAQDGKKDTSLEVLADSGMPSMRGAHEAGDQPFKLSQKGDYLLPISIVMPGDWEIRLTIKREGKVVFRGRYNFDV